MEPRTLPSLAPEIVCEIASYLDDSELSLFARSCRAANASLLPVLYRRMARKFSRARSLLEVLNRAAKAKEKKGFDLVWYARKDIVNPHPASIPGMRRVDQELPHEVEKLQSEEYGNWQHGFNTGMLGMARLFTRILGAREKACSFIDQERELDELGVPRGYDRGSKTAQEEEDEMTTSIIQQALGDFPETDT